MRQKWNYDKDYFEVIDSVEKSYWLGFIMADGYIMDNYKKDNKSTSTGLRIRLSESDEPHLKRFNKDILNNKPIKIVKNYGQYKAQNLAEVTIYSRKIVDDLLKLGLTSGNKSCKEKFPKIKNKNLKKNFILGLFDGDGSISSYKSPIANSNRYGEHYEWQIVSSKIILEEIEKFLSKEVGIKFQKISKNSSKKENDLYRLRTGSKENIKKLFKYFYIDNDNKSYLRRKYKKMKYIYES